MVFDIIYNFTMKLLCVDDWEEEGYTREELDSLIEAKQNENQLEEYILKALLAVIPCWVILYKYNVILF